MANELIIIFLSTFILTVVVTPFIIKVTKKYNLVDCPNDRKKHNGSVPLMGGFAIIIPVLIMGLILQPQNDHMLAIIVGGLFIILAGVLDDLFSLKPLAKLALQIIAAVIVMSSGLMIEYLTVPFVGSVELGLLSYAVTFFWIIGVTNALNLIDGLDGLAGGVAAISFGSIFIMAISDNMMAVVLLSLIFLASLLGFLLYNFHPAKIFLGDTGSLFIGYALAVISMIGLFKNVAIFSFIVPIMVLIIPIIDTVFTIIRRTINKQHIMTADRMHIHYVLLEMGFGHRNTVLIIYAFSMMFGALAIVFTNATMILSLVIMGVLVVTLHFFAELTGIVYGGRMPIISWLKKLVNLK